MVELNLDKGLYASEPVQTVDLTPQQFLNLLQSCSPLSPQYPVLLKIASSLGLQLGLNIPSFESDGLGGYYDENDNYYTQQGLNGFFSDIGNFVSRNVSSGLKDVGKVVGQVVKVAAPVVSAVTGIPVSQIAGFTGMVGNMIGGDIGNYMSAIGNGGVSMRDIQAQNDQAQAEYDKAQAEANRVAQAQYDAEQLRLQQQAMLVKNAQANLIPRTPIGYTANKVQPFTSQFMSPVNQAPIGYVQNSPVVPTKEQVETIASIKNVPAQNVQDEVEKQVAQKLADIKAKETPKTETLFTPKNIAIGVLGLAVVGGGIYMIAKK